MRILFLLPFIFIGLTAAAQTISKQSISAMGGRLEAENNSLVLRQNIGEAQIGSGRDDGVFTLMGFCND